ncbi:hypothetical protein DXG01_000036 [Tephrocybe rancida]|nr:hypothetical protein DXG01_000036 [Tephrocybe rancida]
MPNATANTDSALPGLSVTAYIHPTVTVDHKVSPSLTIGDLRSKLHDDAAIILGDTSTTANEDIIFLASDTDGSHAFSNPEQHLGSLECKVIHAIISADPTDKFCLKCSSKHTKAVRELLAHIDESRTKERAAAEDAKQELSARLAMVVEDHKDCEGRAFWQQVVAEAMVQVGENLEAKLEEKAKDREAELEKKARDREAAIRTQVDNDMEDRVEKEVKERLAEHKAEAEDRAERAKREVTDLKLTLNKEKAWVVSLAARVERVESELLEAQRTLSDTIQDRDKARVLLRNLIDNAQARLAAAAQLDLPLDRWLSVVWRMAFDMNHTDEQRLQDALGYFQDRDDDEAVAARTVLSDTDAGTSPTQRKSIIRRAGDTAAHKNTLLRADIQPCVDRQPEGQRNGFNAIMTYVYE